MIVNKCHFFRAQRKLEIIPYNQTEEWFDKCGNKEENCFFFIDNMEDPQIGFWGVVFARKFIGRHLIISGDCYTHGITIKRIREFYREVINLGFEIIELSSTNLYDISYEIGIRRAGFLRPLISVFSPLTIVINPQQERVVARHWRRNTKKCTDLNLRFEHIENPSYLETREFCRMFEELKEIKNLNYSLSVDSLMKLFETRKYLLFFIYDQKDIPVAGRIIYVNSNCSFDVHAANTNLARELGAAYYIIDMIVLFLKNRGIEHFDYGMISPSSTNMDAIYISKSHSGGTPALYNGQWVFYRSKVIEYLISGYFYFFKKNSRY